MSQHDDRVALGRRVLSVFRHPAGDAACDARGPIGRSPEPVLVERFGSAATGFDLRSDRRVDLIPAASLSSKWGTTPARAGVQVQRLAAVLSVRHREAAGRQVGETPLTTASRHHARADTTAARIVVCVVSPNPSERLRIAPRGSIVQFLTAGRA